MREISLRPITTRPVVRAVVRLKVAPEQEQFVAPNWISIADAYVEKTWHPLAVYAADELIGFVMYGTDSDSETGQWWIIRVMIDKRFQRRGYGRAAILALVELMRDQHGCPSIRLGVDPANQGAIRLYESLGFTATGEVHHDETVMDIGCDGLKG